MSLQLFKIASTTVETPQTSIEFANIPSGYTDLKLVLSLRPTSGSDNYGNTWLTFNGVGGTSYSERTLLAQNGSASSGSTSSAARFSQLFSPGSSATALTFGNIEVYIPNYTSSNYKSISVDEVTENNSTAVTLGLIAGLFSSSAAITSLTIQFYTGTWAAGSTATLYGVL